MPNPGKQLFLPAVAGGVEIGPAENRNRSETFDAPVWCRENVSNGIQVRNVPESIDGTLNPGGIGLRISSRGELACLPEPPTARMAGAHRVSQADPGGADRRAGRELPDRHLGANRSCHRPRGIKSLCDSGESVRDSPAT
jgi:hypothetical protein